MDHHEIRCDACGKTISEAPRLDIPMGMVHDGYDRKRVYNETFDFCGPCIIRHLNKVLGDNLNEHNHKTNPAFVEKYLPKRSK